MRLASSWRRADFVPRCIHPAALVLAAWIGLTPPPLEAQEAAVAGTIVDAASLQPLQGAYVVAGDGGVVARADASGRFVVRGVAGAAAVLEFRALGYSPLLDTVQAGTHGLQVALKQSPLALDAIVVTGTAGAVQGRTVGNDIAKINVATAVLPSAPITNVQQLMTARSPGVMILPYSGNVGTGGAIRIRGTSSLMLSNEPLVYVDGIRLDNSENAGPLIRGGRQVSRINDIDPEDIQNIEIVKGPAAATLYGTEAARGVVQIFTHQGAAGPPRFTFTMKQGANWFMNPAGRMPWVYCSNKTGPNPDLLCGSVLDSVNLFQAEEAAGRHIFQTGRVQSYDAAIGGGTDVMRYYASVNTGRDEGYLSYNWRNRVGGRTNLSLVPNSHFDLGISLAYLQNDTRLAQSPNTYDIIAAALGGTPRTANDTVIRGFRGITPEAIANIDSRSGIQRFIGSVDVHWHPFSWLNQRLTVGGDAGDESSYILFPKVAADRTCFYSEYCSGDKRTDGRRVSYATFDYAASANTRFSEALTGTTSIGAQHYRKRTVLTQAEGMNFPSPEITTLSSASITSSGEDVIENKSVGVFFQQQIGWKRRLFLTGALRADDNSTFGPNFNFVIYPKVSASWVITDESFWKLGVVNALKLRAAWGAAGQQPDAYAAMQSYTPIAGPNDVPTFTPLNPGNPDLKPERSSELELGLDASLWNDRVGITVTHFRQVTRDAVVPNALPPSDGFPGIQLLNIGRVRNRGWELSVNGQVLQSRTLGLELGGALGTQGSLIESMGGLGTIRLQDVGLTPGGNTLEQFREGYPVAAYFYPTVVSAKVDAAGKLVSMACDGGPGNAPVPCDINAPEFFHGVPVPRWQAAVHSTITIGSKLRLYALVDAKGGFINQSTDIGISHQSVANNNSRAIVTASDSLLLAYDAMQRAGVPFAQVAIGMYKGGYAKLREVSVSYTVSGALARRIFGMSQATLSLAGRNLATLWREQKDRFGITPLDPETKFPDPLSGRQQSQLPQSAQVLFTVRLTF